MCIHLLLRIFKYIYLIFIPVMEDIIAGGLIFIFTHLNAPEQIRDQNIMNNLSLSSFPTGF